MSRENSDSSRVFLGKVLKRLSFPLRRFPGGGGKGGLGLPGQGKEPFGEAVAVAAADGPVFPGKVYAAVHEQRAGINFPGVFVPVIQVRV